VSTQKATFTWDGGTVSGAWHHPAHGSAYLVLAHGAGGTVHTPSLKLYAEGLAEHGLGAVRFNFPYAEAGKRGPDRAPVLEACWRAVADQVRARAKTLLLGGRSLGGRMASNIVADGYKAEGLVFLAYPLHPPGKPERIRDEHLYNIKVPMLFLQGTKDPFATPELLEATVAKLPTATVHKIHGGDHSHKVSGRSTEDVIDELVALTMDWLETV